MPDYSFTPEALDDLNKIVLYTMQNWGKSQAINYIDGLNLQASLLAKTPELGTNRSALYPGLLSFPFVSHILYYAKSNSGIVIVRVLNKSMDVSKHFE